MSQTVYFAVKKENVNKELSKHLLGEDLVIDSTGINYNLYSIDIEATLNLENDDVSIDDMEKAEARKLTYARQEMAKYDAKELTYEEVSQLAKRQKELKEQQITANLTEDEIFVRNKTVAFKNDFGFTPSQFGFLTRLRKTIIKDEFIDMQTLFDLSKDRLYEIFDGAEVELVLDFAQKTQKELMDKKVAKKPGIKV